jgi:hypothetical protein
MLDTDANLERHVKDGVLTKELIRKDRNWILHQDVNILIEALLVFRMEYCRGTHWL